MTSYPTLTRRGLLAVGGAALVGAVGGCAAPQARDAAVPTSNTPTSGAPTLVPFRGDHQPGIETEPALFQTFVGVDLTEDGPAAAQAALVLLTDDAERLMAGQPALGDPQPDLALNADQLTVTVGLGRSLFERTGLASRIPDHFPVIPSFSTDRLEQPWGETDLLLQVGANDPVALAHALRVLIKDLSTLATVRWTQPGFRSSAPGTMGVAARRNLMGQVEGTHFPQPGTAEFATVVWADSGPEWAVGGTVLVLRRIRMLMDRWDRLDRSAQETVMGRSLADGELLGSDGSTSPFDAVDINGLPIIPADAHVRVARADSLEGVIMRRPFNYDSGVVDGSPDCGLLFAAYTSDPRRSFIPTQERLSQSDAFHRWIRTVGSATYLLPRGARPGEVLAHGLFA